MELTVNCTGARTSNPSDERRNEQQFECPLCVDIFKQFSQLKWHLLSMHPRRDMIMELVKERYGMSSPPGAAHEKLKKWQPSRRLGQKQPQRLTGLPLELGKQAVALPQIQDQCDKREEEGSCEES